MSVQQNYSVGGVLDEIKKINWPAHLFPRFTKSLSKGLEIQVPALTGVYTAEYECPVDMEIINVSLACSGYADGDYWEVVLLEPGQDPYKLVETMPTRELAESINMGNVLYIVQRVVAGTIIRFDFYNQSGTSKRVWPAFRVLRE